jgi:hypothetical protein
MAIIKIKNSFQGKGGSRLLDDNWAEYKKFDNGFFEETETRFVFKATNGQEIKADKDKIALATNDFVAYRGFKNESTNGPGSLMIIIQKNNKNTFNVEGSSPLFGTRTPGAFFLEFEVSQEIKDADLSKQEYLKKVELNRQQLGLLANAFTKAIFPRPNEGELFYTNSLNNNCLLYFTTEYYKRLMDQIQDAYDQGLFSSSNSEPQWNNLSSTLKCALTERKTSKTILHPYPAIS